MGADWRLPTSRCHGAEESMSRTSEKGTEALAYPVTTDTLATLASRSDRGTSACDPGHTPRVWDLQVCERV